MTIIQRDPNRKRVLDLAGPEGNAYALMGYANRTAKQLGIDPQPIIDEMKAGDYDNLVAVFDKHFGHIYDLIAVESEGGDYE